MKKINKREVKSIPRKKRKIKREKTSKSRSSLLIDGYCVDVTAFYVVFLLSKYVRAPCPVGSQQTSGRPSSGRKLWEEFKSGPISLLQYQCYFTAEHM